MSDTVKLYQDEPFCRCFTAHVTVCREERGGWVVLLDRTAFFPEGGGQPCDLGTLTPAGGTAVNVLDVHERDGLVLHTVDGPLPEGEAVDGVLDWERRRDAMEQHSGEHILSGILHTLYGAENVGFHIGPDLVRMDMSVELSAAQLARAEALANAVVREDADILVSYPSDEALKALVYRSKKEIDGQVRIVTIPEADVCACCGTHLARTGQVGLVKILSHQNYKGGTRLTVVCGGRAFAALAQEHDALTAIAQAVSARPETAAESVNRLLAENAALKAARVSAENLWFAALAENATPDTPCIQKVDEVLSGDSLRRLCLACAGHCGALTAVFCPSPQGGLSYALTLPDGDVRPACKAMNEAFGGRGGGKPMLCQGSLPGSDFAPVKALLVTL